MKTFIMALLAAFILAACSSKSNTPPQSAQTATDLIINDLNNEAVFFVVGEGVPPIDTVSPAQAQALAKRAAIADGYRQLASKLYGVKINAKETVKDAMLKSSVVESRVVGLIKNATLLNQEFKDGLFRVEIELKLDQQKWHELFSY